MRRRPGSPEGGDALRPYVRRLVALVVALAAGVFSGTSATAQEMTYGEVTVTRLPELPVGASHGYFETAFRVSNASASRPREVTIEVPAAGGFGSGGHVLKRASRTVLVGPRATARVAILLPALPSYGSDARVSIDGRAQPRLLPWSTNHPQHWVLGSTTTSTGTAPPQILLSPRYDQADFGPAVGTDLGVHRAVSPVETWSEAWLAYSGYDGVVVGAEDLAAAPQGVAAALRRAAVAGGNLLVLGSAEGHPLRGSGAPARTAGAVRVYVEGFGLVLAAPVRSVAELTLAERALIDGVWGDSVAPWVAFADPTAFQVAFPVVDRLSVPVRGLFATVVVFTVLIGPVNVAVLTRRRRRMWLLVTVPALSLLTCLLVLAWALLGEGLLRLRRTEAITVLDQRSREAATVALSSYYSTLAPAGGLRFDAATEVTPMVQLGWGAGSGGLRTVDWTEGQHLASGWISSRLPAGFALRKSESRRERLEVARRADGRLEAINGLGADLEGLWVADRDGRLHAAPGGVAAGATAVLAPTGETAAGEPGLLRGVLRPDLSSRLGALRTAPARALGPGTYLAALASTPFVEPGLATRTTSRVSSLVFGILGEEGAP